MGQRSRRRAKDHKRVRQLDLFGERATTSPDWPEPAWQVLPEEARRALTVLMSRLLLDHGYIEHRPCRTEVADDV